MVTHRLQVELRTRKFAGKRPTFYRCSTQPGFSLRTASTDCYPDRTFSASRFLFLVLFLNLFFCVWLCAVDHTGHSQLNKFLFCIVSYHTASPILEFLTKSLWPPYAIWQAIIFSCCGFYLLSIYLSIFFPRLISEVGDWMSTILRHMVWP